MALMLVLVAVIISATMAYSYVGTQSTSITIARNIRDHTRARYVAETGLEATIAYLQRNDNWRQEKSQGTWVSDAPFGGGTFTIACEDGQDANADGVITTPDEGDGDLADDGSDLLTVTAIGRIGGACHVIRAVITPGASDMVGHWKLDETSGLIGADASGQENHGIVTNTVVPVPWEAARIHGALNLDGYDDFVAVADHDLLDLTDAGTLALWFKMDSPKPFAGLIHKGDARDFSDEAYTLQFWSSNKIYFGLLGQPGERSMQTRTAFANGRWYHVAAVWDASGMYIYVDGKLDNSSRDSVSVRKTQGNLNLGAQLAVYYSSSYRNLPFDGMIDDVRVYSRALSAEQIKELASDLDVPEGGPIPKMEQFGYETDLLNDQNGVAAKQIATRVVLDRQGILSAISACVRGPAAGRLRYAVYADVSGRPGALISETEPELLGSDMLHWHEISLPPAALPPGYYWLALGFDNEDTCYRYANWDGESRHADRDAVAGGFSNPWGSSSTSTSRRISIYGSFIPTGGGVSGGEFVVDWQP